MNLQLSLKTNWFKMTREGIKKEDYREITTHWFKRFVFKWRDVMLYHGYNELTDERVVDIILNSQMYGFNPFSQNTMTLGYPKKGDTSRVIKLEHKGIEIRTGNPEWGAESNKLYFVIKHGVFLNEA